MTNPSLPQSPARSKMASYAWVIFAVVYFASLVSPFNQFKIPPIMPVLMKALQIDLTQAGLLMTIIATIGLALALPTGVILQRWGAKTTLLVALALMAAGSALGALSGNFAFLLGSRIVEGLGMGLMGVAAPAIIAMWFPPERRGTPMGIWATWVPLGTVAIYNLSPMLTSSYGWQTTWWVGAGFAGLMVLISGWLIALPPTQEAARSQSEAPFNFTQVFANRDIWLLALEFACMNMALIAFGTYYPTFLNQVRDYPLGEAAFIASLSTLVVLFSAPAAGWLTDHFGSRRLVLTISFFIVAVLFVLPFQVTGWQISAILIVQGLALGAIPAVTFAVAPQAMRNPEWAGWGLAIVLLGQNLGQLVGPVFFSQMVSMFGWAAAGYLLIPVCLVGCASSWAVKIR